MKRYIVKFVELRHYEMSVEAYDEQSAIKRVRTGPEHPRWVNVEVDHFYAQEVTA
jgi:hypothetical protein